MKENYFTTQSLDRQALELYTLVADQPQKKTVTFQPERSALLVTDMQGYFLDPASHAYIPSAGAILNRITQLIALAYAHEIPVFFTQHSNTRTNAGMMAIWWKDVLRRQNPLHRIASEIDVSRGTLVRKSQYDAFHATRLDELLRAKGVTQLIICGVMTHLCCESTARSAFMKGYQVFFPVDGTATYNIGFHWSSLVNLAHGFAVIVLMKELMDMIRGEHED